MTTAQQPASALRAGQTRNLVLATLAFAITFWAWNLIAPLGVFYASPGEMDLNASQKSILIAVPILVGSLGRIVVGVLTPRFGGRVMFTALLLLSVPFVILVAVAGELKSYPLMIVIGFFLGIAGTSFAAGIPFLNNWYEPARRGFATGVFGAGMGGPPCRRFHTPVQGVVRLLPDAHHHRGRADRRRRHLLGRNAGRADVDAQHRTTMPKLVDALKLPITWQMAFPVCRGVRWVRCLLDLSADVPQ